MSNLKFISKTLERAFCSILVDHLQKNNLLEVLQSAYRKYHSTETALVKVVNDVLRAVDEDGGCILVLLDLSAAFDTIDHDKLLRILEINFGIIGSALEWIRSYLANRSQKVSIGLAFSELLCLLFGVPQGSVLGPILFIIYTTPLGEIIRRHGINFHLYADDTQNYLAFRAKDAASTQEALKRIEAFIEEVRLWMKLYLLKLNDDKTELIIISAHPEQNVFYIEIGGHLILPDTTFSEPPRNLGLYFDAKLNFDLHVRKACKSMNYNLY